MKAGLTKADRAVDPAVTAPAPGPARPRAKAPARAKSDATPVPADAGPSGGAEPARKGRAPGNRTKRTLYVDQDLIDAVERKHYELVGVHGRFPLANVLDAVLQHALDNWNEVAAMVDAERDGRKDRHAR